MMGDCKMIHTMKIYLALVMLIAAVMMAGCKESGTEEERGETAYEASEAADESLSGDTADCWRKYNGMPLDTVLGRLAGMRWLPECGYGWTGEPIDSWGCHIRMDELCDNECLARLAKSHPAPVARAMAFDILHDRRYEGCYRLMTECLRDTATIIWGSDLMLTGSVASYMVGRMEEIDDGGWYRKKYLTMAPKQQHELDSILLARPNMGHIERLKGILDTLRPDPKYYSRIRTMYLEEGVIEAIPALARYRNEQDIALIQELASHYSDKTERYETTVIGLEAVAVWPDSRFWPMLRRIRNFVVWKHYTDGDYNDLMRGCTKAAYHYYSPQALRYIRSFSTLTLGKMDAAWDFCEACWQDNAWHKEGFSGRAPECYKTYFRKYQNR